MPTPRKSAAKPSKAPSKSRKATLKPPTVGLAADLKAVFEKHNWPGHPVGVMAAMADSCPPGTSPHTVTYTDENGTIVTKTMCLPD